MFTFLTALVELVGILLKSLIKSCAPSSSDKKHGNTENHRRRKAETQTPVQSHHKSTKRSDNPRGEGSPMPKKRRRASITERTVSTTEKIVEFDLGSSGSSSPNSYEKT